MKYRVSDICKQVRECLEQNVESQPLIETDDIDTLAWEDIARSKIVPAAKYITQNASLYLCGHGVSLDERINWKKDATSTVGIMVLPQDYWRLLTFQLSTWKRQGTIISDKDAEYALQASEYAGIRGNAEAPVVAICHYPEGLTLEMYSVTGNSDTIKRASYLQIPCITEDGGIEIPERLCSAVVYYAAYMVALTYSAVGVANDLLRQALVQAGIEQPTPSTQTQQE